MRCEDIRKRWELRVGALSLIDEEREHIAGCPECTAYYERLAAVEEELRSLTIPAITGTEFAVVQGKLDGRISEYQSRAGRFNRLTARIGVGVATAVLLFLVIYFGQWGSNEGTETISSGKPAGALSVDSAISQIYAAINSNTGQVTDTTTEESLDDKYVNVVVGDYTRSYGVGASDALLGDISKEEMEYLNSKMKPSDIL